MMFKMSAETARPVSNSAQDWRMSSEIACANGRAAVERVAIREQHVERERARVAVRRQLGALAGGGVVSDDKGVDEAQRCLRNLVASSQARTDPRPDYRIKFGLDLVRWAIQRRVGRVAVRRPRGRR